MYFCLKLYIILAYSCFRAHIFNGKHQDLPHKILMKINNLKKLNDIERKSPGTLLDRRNLPMAAMPPGRRIAEGGPRPIEFLVGLGGTVGTGSRDWREALRTGEIPWSRK